jgi:hypothetical protein
MGLGNFNRSTVCCAPQNSDSLQVPEKGFQGISHLLPATCDLPSTEGGGTMGFLTGIHLVGAVLGFLAGVFGFIIVRYWIRPVSAYGRLKRKIADAVIRHLALAADPPESGNKADLSGSQKQLRRLAQELTDAFHHDLPHWYRIRLRSRGEQPPEAAAGLMKLSGSLKAEPARKGAEKIRRLLHLKNETT